MAAAFGAYGPRIGERIPVGWVANTARIQYGEVRTKHPFRGGWRCRVRVQGDALITVDIPPIDPLTHEPAVDLDVARRRAEQALDDTAARNGWMCEQLARAVIHLTNTAPVTEMTDAQN